MAADVPGFTPKVPANSQDGLVEAVMKVADQAEPPMG